MATKDEPKETPADDKPADPSSDGNELNDEEMQAEVNEVLGIEGDDVVNDLLDTEEGEDEDGDGDKGDGDDEEPNDEGDGEEGAGQEEEADEEVSDDQPAGDEGEEDRVPEDPPKPEDTEDKPAPELEVKTDDLWVEVEDAEGKKHKVTVEGGMDDLPDDFKFAGDKDLAKLMDSINEMRSLKKEREAEVETNKEEQASKEEQAAQIQEWDNEIYDLIEAGILEAPKLKQGDPKYKSDPAIQEISAIFDYMQNQNEERSKDGKAIIKSFAVATNLYKAEQSKSEEAEKQKEDNKVAKAKSDLVGGSPGS